jgi:hypothetical protein
MRYLASDGVKMSEMTGIGMKSISVRHILVREVCKREKKEFVSAR